HASASKIVLRTSFHHMNESGFYDGWTEHIITVIPDLVNGFDLRISGRNKNDVKEYIADVFYEVLRSEFVWDGHKIKRTEPQHLACHKAALYTERGRSYGSYSHKPYCPRPSCYLT